MNHLKCTTANCQHNLNNHCNAGVVSVNEAGKCITKMKRPGGALEQTFEELEVGREFMQDSPNWIQCTAECIYNKDKKCTANRVLIADSFLQTKCATRVKR